jgi:cysteine desulfurase / selenocysteine lyase
MNLYFNNAATSWPKAPGVAEAMFDNIESCMGSPGRSHYFQSQKLLFSVRQLLAGLLGADESSRIVFGLNTTHMINTGIRGVLKSGDHVVTTSMEHNAVSRPLRYMEKYAGVRLTIVPSSPDGLFDINAIVNAVTEQTKLVVVNHSSNVTGAINRVNSLGGILRESNAYFMVDGAQSAGAVNIDVKKHKIDMLAGPGHKNLLGPSGIGFLYLSKRCKPCPLIYGGTGSFSDSDDQPEELPDCYESGTHNIPGLAGLSAALSFINETTLKAIVVRKNEITKKILDGLTQIKGLTLYGPSSSENRMPVFSLGVPGKDIADVAEVLRQKHGVITRVGLHCSPWAHKTIGSYPEGTIRISAGFFHTDSDINRMLEALDHSVRNC